MRRKLLPEGEEKLLSLPVNLLEQCGLFQEVELEVTPEGLLVKPRLLNFEAALQEVFEVHGTILQNLADR